MKMARLVSISKAVAVMLALACISGIVAPAGATTLIYKNFDDLVTEAEAIVVGTVRQAESHYGPHKDIYTFVTLTDLQVIHGEYKQNALVLRLAGGEIDGVRVVFDGSPKFMSSEKFLIFLQGNGKHLVPIVGWTQGIFRITRDPDSQKDIITDYAGNRIFGVDKNELVKEYRRTRAVPLEDETGFIKGAAVHPGVMDNGSRIIPVSVPVYVGDNLNNPNIPSLSASDFISAIRERVAKQRKPRMVVNSVGVMDFINLISYQSLAPAPEGFTANGN